MTPELLEAMEAVRNPHLPQSLMTFDANYQDACELLARYLVEHAGELVRVKGLAEWQQRKPWLNCDRQEWRLDTPFGSMEVREDRDGKFSCTGCGGVIIDPCGSLEDGKAKAEQWYRACLAAALEPLIAKGDA